MAGMLTVNEHPVERGIRVVLGLGLIGLAVAGVFTPWGYIGIVPLLTGAIGSCPLYSIMGVSTCPVRKSGTA
ncbi:MAG: DUF2892 domain-containing protein [Vicinamibacterales bacterium]